MNYLTKYILTLMVLFSSLFASDLKYDMYMNELENLDYNQRSVLYKAYAAGMDDGLEYTLASIAWKESDFGVYITNLGDGSKGSFGPFHALLDTVKVRYGAKNTWQASRLAERLIKDFDFAADNAITELRLWKEHWHNKGPLQYRYMVASYNAGGKSYNSPKGKAYTLDIILRMKVLQDYFKKHDPMKLRVKPDNLSYVTKPTNLELALNDQKTTLYSCIMGDNRNDKGCNSLFTNVPSRTKQLRATASTYKQVRAKVQYG